jgi:DNA-binding XRE family transcriptional regulator
VKKDSPSPLGSDAALAESHRVNDPAYRAERLRRAPYERIARLVITQRMATGLTQKALADQVGTSESAICRLERGDHAPSLDTLRRLAAVFGKELVVDFVAANAAPI